MAYFDLLCEAMSMLAEQENTIFLGQAVKYPGTAMFNSLSHLPEEKRLELPVAEDMQMGMSTGLALAGYLPISIYPRINFLLLATNQLVLHLDKIPIYGNGFKPKVIIRTAVAVDKPLDPGPQHLYDYSYGLKDMLQRVKIIRLQYPYQIIPSYKAALERSESSLIVEYMELYDK